MKGKLDNFDLQAIMASEQIRKCGMGLIAGIMVLLAVWFLAVRPAQVSIQEMQDEIKDLERRSNNKQTVIDQADIIEKKYEQTGEKLKTIIEQDMAPERAALGWASRRLRSAAAATGLEVRDYTGSTVSPPGRGGDQIPPLLENFSTRFELRGGYHQIGRFFAVLEKELPYALMRNLSISPQRRRGRDSQLLQANVTYRFPRFTEEGFPPEKRPSSENE